MARRKPTQHALVLMFFAPLVGHVAAGLMHRQASDADRLRDLLADDWAYRMKESPELATRLGYRGQDHRWKDFSLQAFTRRHQHYRGVLEALRSIERSKLSPADQLNYDLYLMETRERVEEHAFQGYLMPLNQLEGVQRDVPEVIAQTPTSTVQDYENILARLRGIPALIDQTIELMNKGLESGLTLPKVTLRDLPQQVETLVTGQPEASPLLVPFRRFPDSFSPQECERLKREGLQALTSQVIPAYRRLHDYLVQTYLPAARETTGLRDLPNGQDCYAFMVRHHTTTNLTAQQIHEIGLTEVHRIRAEMEKVKAQAGFQGSFAEFLEFMRTDPQFFFNDRQSLLVSYRNIAKRVDPELVKLFGRLPRLPYGVIPIPSHLEVSQTSAYYQIGSPQAGRPGYFFVNTYDLNARPKWEMEALTLHEAVPGHHLQIALAQELAGLPDFRRHAEYTGFVEGWALYAESLGEAMGFYADPYSKFGQLTFEMWRAVRLVVDTGLHALGWSRQQAIDFFKEYTPKSEHDIVVEVDRYIVSPGQALAYKIGELKIKELRAYASAEMGAAFDLRAFHDAVLGQGPLPLDILERRVKQWVAEQKARSPLAQTVRQ